MLFVSPPAKILVTGANGFIAIWVVKRLLDHDYRVRGTIRSPSKSAHLKNVFQKEVEEGRLELVIVPDITKPDAFKEALKDIDAVGHTASPCDFTVDDPDDLVLPAVKGTVGLLSSATAEPRLKRIVILSSVGAVRNPDDRGVLDERNWNDQDIREIRQKGRDANQLSKYCASKSIAEKAAWEFYHRFKRNISWDMVTLCPPFTYGPMLHEVSSPESLNTSQALLFDAMLSGRTSISDIDDVQESWVDVRDIAEAHVKALQESNAGGERFVLTAGPYIWQDWLDVSHELGIPGVPTGKPGRGKLQGYGLSYNTSKAADILGMNWRTMSTCVADIVDDMRTRGWLRTADS